MVDVIKFSRKIISVGYQTRYIMHKRLVNGINISRIMFFKFSFRWYYRSLLGPYVYVGSFVCQLCSVD